MTVKGARFFARKTRGFFLHVRAYVWARTELGRVRELLPEDGVLTRARPPQVVAPDGRRGVFFALSKTDQNCLERALVLQAWMSTSGNTPDVIIGVRRNESILEAHAWVEGADPWFDLSYSELKRLEFTPEI